MTGEIVEVPVPRPFLEILKTRLDEFDKSPLGKIARVDKDALNHQTILLVNFIANSFKEYFKDLGFTDIQCAKVADSVRVTAKIPDENTTRKPLALQVVKEQLTRTFASIRLERETLDLEHSTEGALPGQFERMQQIFQDAQTAMLGNFEELGVPKILGYEEKDPNEKTS